MLQMISASNDASQDRVPVSERRHASESVIAIALIEHHTLTRLAMRRVIAELPQIAIVAEVSAIADMLRIVSEPGVQVIVLGPSMPISDCLHLMELLSQRQSYPGIIAMQSSLGSEIAWMLVRQGIHGLLDEFASEQDLAHAIMAAAAGNTFLSQHTRELLAASTPSPAIALTPRELQVLMLLVRGESNYCIARALGIKEKTVEAHLTHLYEKLGVHSRVEAVLYARTMLMGSL
jgi:NarL family two-component system response regulator LiaR